MRLESALYSSREGLTSHGQAISVVGDNVSNANTTAYKRSRAEFADLLAEGDEGAQSSADPVEGGGSTIQTVRTIFDAGVLEPTGRSLDVGIDGNGFFLFGDTAAPKYSRAGNLSVDKNGQVVNGEGLALLGYSGTGTTLGPVSVANSFQSGKPTTAGQLYGNLASSVPIGAVPAAATTFNELNAAAGLAAGDLQVYDSLGKSHSLSLYCFKTAANTWTARTYIDGGEVTGGTAGQPVQVGNDVTLNFGPDGRLTEASAAAAVINGAPAYAGGAAAGSFALNLSTMSQFATNSALSTFTQDGVGAAVLDKLQIESDGSFNVVFDNGQTFQVAKIPVATFTNVDGLQRAGSSMYVDDGTAGEANIGVPGEGGRGSLQGGSLEQSGVDVANEFVNLVLYQRGYQANSQTLNATSTLLRDTIALIR